MPACDLKPHAGQPDQRVEHQSDAQGDDGEAGVVAGQDTGTGERARNDASHHAPKPPEETERIGSCDELPDIGHQ